MNISRWSGHGTLNTWKETCKTVKGQQVKNSWYTSIRQVVSGLFLTFPISSSPDPPALLGMDFVGSPSSTGCSRSIPTSSVGLSVRRRRNIPDKANFLRFSVDMVFVFTLKFKSNRTRNICSLKLFLLTVFQFVYVIAQIMDCRKSWYGTWQRSTPKQHAILLCLGVLSFRYLLI